MVFKAGNCCNDISERERFLMINFSSLMNRRDGVGVSVWSELLDDIWKTLNLWCAVRHLIFFRKYCSHDILLDVHTIRRGPSFETENLLLCIFCSGCINTFVTVYMEDGVRKGLYRGLSINYLRVVPQVAVMFSVYELTKQFLSQEVTSSRSEWLVYAPSDSVNLKSTQWRLRFNQCS